MPHYEFFCKACKKLFLKSAAALCSRSASRKFLAFEDLKLRFPGIEHGYGKVIEVLDIPSR
jgi:hypothetical protein